MKFLKYLFDLSKYRRRLYERSRGYFISGTIFNIIGSILIFLLISLGFACLNIELSFSGLGEAVAGGLGGALGLVVGIILILASVVAVIKNIPHQILVAVVGFKRYKTEGKAFLVCGIISIATLIVLLMMIVLQFIGI